MKKEIVEFNIQDMWPIALTFIVVGIGIAYGLDAIVDVRDDVSDANASQAINKTIEGISKLPDKLPTIATVVVAAIIIGILVRYLGGGR